MIRRLPFFALIMSLAILSLVLAGQAAASGISDTTGNITFNIPIGNLTGCSISETSNNCLGEYIKAWYGFAIGIAGIFATMVIMYGGFKYLTSRGDKGVAGKGKDYIVGAATGLALVFLSYTIVSLVNPNLTVITMPTMSSIKDNSGIDLNKSMLENVNESDGTSAQPIGLESVVGSSDPNMDKLTGTRNLVDSASSLLTTLQQQGKIPPGLTVTSGYRAGSSGQHGAGNAFDVAWPNMTIEQADAFVSAVQAANPAFSTIIEFNGTYGSTGNNVHLDLRPTPVHLRGI